MCDLEKTRNEKLIMDREEYEKVFFSQIIDEMIESDALDELISDRLNYIDDNFDFEPSPEYLRLEEIYFAEYESKFHDEEDIDHMEDYDYPEGINENLNGQIIEEHVYDDFIDLEPDFEDEIDYSLQYEEFQQYDESDDLSFENSVPDEFYEALFEEDEAYYKELIDSHVDDEQKFLDSILIDAIQEDHYFEKAIDELIFEHMADEYDGGLFDYDEEPYWYDDCDGGFSDYVSDEDESAADPFDSFDEIDYPDIGEPQYRDEASFEIDYEEEMIKDFQRYQRNEEHLMDYEEEVPDYDAEQIVNPAEDQNDFRDVDEIRNQELIEKQNEIELKFKKYIAKDDTLDNMIKEKLKEKKFNQ